MKCKINVLSKKIECDEEKILTYIQGNSYSSDATSYTSPPYKENKDWLLAWRKIIFDATGHAYFSNATGHTSPSGYEACWWPPINPFCIVFQFINIYRNCKPKRYLKSS